ncbi:hypothetical protein MTO96_035602 [Rhipicephalus appendiculatus]
MRSWQLLSGDLVPEERSEMTLWASPMSIDHPLSWLRTRILLRGRRFPLANIVLVLVSTLLGRCPHDSAGRVAKVGSGLLALWMIGMLFLGNYIQTALISVVNVGKLTPKTERGFKGFCALTHGLRKRLAAHMAAHQGGRSCYLLYNVSDCFGMVSEGEHVAVKPCGAYEVLAAAEWDLVPEERSEMTLWASPMSIDHPLRYQHRRMLLAVAETGLAVPFMKRPSHQKSIKEEEPSEDTVLFSFVVYAIGVLLSSVALMSEVLWHKWVNRRRKSTAVCWRLRLPWTRTTTVRPFSE